MFIILQENYDNNSSICLFKGSKKKCYEYLNTYLSKCQKLSIPNINIETESLSKDKFILECSDPNEQIVVYFSFFISNKKCHLNLPLLNIEDSLQQFLNEHIIANKDNKEKQQFAYENFLHHIIKHPTRGMNYYPWIKVFSGTGLHCTRELEKIAKYYEEEFANSEQNKDVNGERKYNVRTNYKSTYDAYHILLVDFYPRNISYTEFNEPIQISYQILTDTRLKSMSVFDKSIYSVIKDDSEYLNDIQKLLNSFY